MHKPVSYTNCQVFSEFFERLLALLASSSTKYTSEEDVHHQHVMPLDVHCQRFVTSAYTHALKSVITFVVPLLHQLTPLHMAAKKGRCESILVYLVDNGADINIKDNNGVNTYHYSIKRKLIQYMLRV